jgi:hypothetical protein
VPINRVVASGSLVRTVSLAARLNRAIIGDDFVRPPEGEVVATPNPYGGDTLAPVITADESRWTMRSALRAQCLAGSSGEQAQSSKRHCCAHSPTE